MNNLFFWPIVALFASNCAAQTVNVNFSHNGKKMKVSNNFSVYAFYGIADTFVFENCLVRANDITILPYQESGVVDTAVRGIIVFEYKRQVMAFCNQNLSLYHDQTWEFKSDTEQEKRHVKYTLSRETWGDSARQSTFYVDNPKLYRKQVKALIKGKITPTDFCKQNM